MRGLGVRAANHARREHLPTYIALRLLLASQPREGIDKWISEFAKTRCLTRRHARYHHYKIFKGFSDHQPAYRSCYSPSPASLVTEAFILAALSPLAEFSVPDCVYSYCWPSEKSGQSYQFFLSGYKRKQAKIRELLSYHPEDYAVFITDIERFYPSSNTRTLREKFSRRLDRSTLPSELKNGINSAVEDLFSIPQCEGIPIGSALGHVFGHVALDNVDHEMSGRIGDRYLRYVDDITIVLPKDEIEDARVQLEKLVNAAGYTLKPEKTHTVSGELWQSSMIDEALMERFNRLHEDIILFLMLYPGSFDEIRTALRNSGLNLPISVFRHVAEYSRTKAVFYHIKKFRYPSSIAKIIQRATSLRDDLLEYYFSSVSGAQPALSPIDDKLDIQRLRWCINRLVYLCPLERYPQILKMIPLHDELIPYAALLSGIIGRNVDGILSYPGRITAAFAQLWAQIHPNVVLDAPYNTLLEGPQLHSAAALAAYGIISRDAFGSSQFNSREDELLIRFSTSQIPKRRELTDLSYIDELRTLMLGADQSFCRDALETRFDDAEISYMDALAMGAGGYS